VSGWASPIVSVLKPDKVNFICGDFKQTVNPVSTIDKHPPIPKVEDLFTTLAGGGGFLVKLISVKHIMISNSF